MREGSLGERQWGGLREEEYQRGGKETKRELRYHCLRSCPAGMRSQRRAHEQEEREDINVNDNNNDDDITEHITEHITYLVVVGDGGGGDGLHDPREHERAAVAAGVEGLSRRGWTFSSSTSSLSSCQSIDLSIADLESEGRDVGWKGRCDFFSSGGVVCFDESRAPRRCERCDGDTRRWMDCYG